MNSLRASISSSRRTTLRSSAFFSFCTILFFCAFIFSGCENDPHIIAELNSSKELTEEAKDIQTFMSQGGRMRAKLWAPYMIRHERDTIFVEFPRNLNVNFFDSLGHVESHLFARYGKYFESLNKVYLRDSVLVYNMQGDTLRCPELWWDQNSQKFYTDKSVRVRKSGNLIFGNGMDAQQDLTNINIRQVTGTVLVPDSLRAH